MVMMRDCGMPMCVFADHFADMAADLVLFGVKNRMHSVRKIFWGFYVKKTGHEDIAMLDIE